MAMLAVPLLGAAVGYFTVGTTLAMSVGWLIGSWIYSAFLAEDQNQIFDPGAQELPRINQALRGVTMNMMFGTNRVSPNIVWTKNWQAIRTESSSSGGKGGGSGGKPQGPTSVSYEYKIDILYHFGMVPTPYSIFRGWMNADLLTDATIIAILQGSGNFTSALPNPDDTDANAPVNMGFDDAFWGAGGATGDTNFQNWDYFETQEGVGTRWPWTVYIGLQALSLGGNSAIPQLSFEIGPGDPEFGSTGTDEQRWTDTNNLNGSDYIAGSGANAGFVVGEDGKRYWFPNFEDDNEWNWYCLETGAHHVLTAAEVNANAVAKGIDGGRTFIASLCGSGAFGIAGTPYFFITATTGIAFDGWYLVHLYKIDSTGTAVPYYGINWHTDTVANNITNSIQSFHIANEGTIEDYVLILGEQGSSGVHHNCIWCIPSISSLLNFGDVDDGTLDKWDAVREDLDGLGLDDIDVYTRGNAQTGSGFVLPTAVVGPLGIQWGCRLYFLVPKSRIDEEIDSPTACTYIQGLTGTYPNGFVFYVPLSVIAGVVTASAPVVDNDAFNTPFADDGYRLDGVTYSTLPDYKNNYSPSVQAIKIESLAQYASLVVFTKGFFETTDHTDSNHLYAKAVAYVWNPFTKVGSLVLSQGQETSIDFQGSDDPWEPEWVQVIFDPSTQTSYVMTGMTGDVYVGEFGSLTISGSGGDLTPAQIIYLIMTNTTYGMSVPTELIDASSYANAVAWCETNNIKVSVQYTRDDNFLNVINELLALYGGYLTESGGIIKFGVVELSSTPVRTIDNHHLVIEEDEPPVTITRAARQDTANIIKVNYLDRNLFYRQNTYEISDEVDVDLNGPRVKEFPAKFVMSEATAAMIAARTLWSNLYGRDLHDFQLGVKDGDLEPGDVITLVDSFHTELSTGRKVRIVSWKENVPGRYAVKAVSEIDYISSSSAAFYNVSSPSAVRTGLNAAAQAPLDFRAYELPKEFQGSDASVFFGYNQAQPTMGSVLYLSPDGVTFAAATDIQPFIISGLLPEALPERPAGFCEQDYHLWLFPASGFDANTPTYAQTHALDDFSQSIRAVGGAILYAGSEAMAAQGLTLVAQNHYKVDKLWRGWGGTAIQGHNSGAYWHRHGAGMHMQTITTDKIGTMMYYKIVPYNFINEGYNVSSIPSKSWQVQGTYWRPQEPSRLATFVQSPTTITQSDDLRNMARKQVTSGGCDIVWQWPDASREEGMGLGGFGFSGFGHFATDTTSAQWRVQILSADMSTVVRCMVVSTGTFTYSRAVNSADFNGWTGNLGVRVLPYNNYGAALSSRTQSLALFTA